MTIPLIEEDIEEEEPEEYKKKKIHEETISNILVKLYHVKYYNLDYYKFTEGYYRGEQKSYLEEDIQRIFDSLRSTNYQKKIITTNKVTEKYVKEVLGHIRRTCTIRDNDINPWLIGTRNAVIDIRNKIINQKPGPDTFVPAYINCRFDPNAGKSNELESLKSDKFIEDIVGEEYKDTVYEIIGDCLIPEYPFKKITLFHGARDSGKSTLARYIVHFLGKINVSPISCFDFKHQFRLADVLNKLAIVSSDLPTGWLGDQNIGHLKILSGGDAFLVEKKYEGSIYYVNRARIIYTSNFTPSLSKEQLEDDAHIGRWNIIPCKNHFEINDELFDTLITDEELSGLLNNVLKGVKRLIQNKKFSRQSTVEENRVEFDKNKQKYDARRYNDYDILNMDSEEMMKKKRENIYGKKE